MPIRLEFHGWKRPPLPSAVDWLIGQYGSDQLVDMDHVVVVVPGNRAGRRLREILLARIDELKLAYYPPRITTVGQLPELLYQPRLAFAGQLVQQLVWARALRESDRSVVEQVIAEVPVDEDDPRWIEIGGLLRRQHRELAADGLDFSDVARIGSQLEGFDESDRWKTLATIQQTYLRILDSLRLWDRQTARLVAIEHRECQLDGQIVLLGMADMNQTLRRMLDQVADQVTALVYAPPAWADRFDQHGCLDPAAWQEIRIDLETDQVHLVDNPADQVDEVVRVLAAEPGAYRADQITIGVPDETLVPHLERQLAQYNVPARWGPGTPVTHSAPYKLLAAVADLLQSGDFADFAALVRHPDVGQWLTRLGARGDWLTELDRYYTRHLPARLGTDWLGPAAAWGMIRQVQQHIRTLLQPLGGGPRPPGAWSEALSQLLLDMYGDDPWNLDDPSQRQTVLACEQVHDALATLTEIPQSLAPAMTASATIHLALQPLQSNYIPSTTTANAIELLGWLELPLDDAPALIVTSCHEGVIPESVNSDLFLPNALRCRLGLDDNARRYARDALSLNMLLASREQLTLIVARRDSDGNPVLPSRLLFAADEETIARRARRFFDQPGDSPPALAGPLVGQQDHSRLRIPRPAPLREPITRLSPTAFRDYLACPYRFYLQHVLRLETVSDDAQEMDGAAFGSLLHEVLRRFGNSLARESSDAVEITQTLREMLDRCVCESFGQHPVVAVRVQVEQLRTRLKAFAEKQADWCQQGWRIAHTEVPSAPASALLQVDDEPIHLSGRIDRIDVHAETGEHMILDYKSSDAGKGPEKTHRNRGQWVDLQLPLYRHLARGFVSDVPMRLGFILLPKDTNKTGFAMAPWTDQELKEADDVARDVVRKIRQQIFWPPNDPPARFVDPFAPVCQVGVFGREAVRGA